MPTAIAPFAVACAPIPIATEYDPLAVVGVVVGFPESSSPTDPNAKDFSPVALAAEPNAYESSPVACVAFPRAKALCRDL